MGVECARNVILRLYIISLRLIYIFVGLTDFAKRDVLPLVDEIPRYRNYHYHSSAFKFLWSRCLKPESSRLDAVRCLLQVLAAAPQLLP